MKPQKLISLCLILALLASSLCLPAAAAEASDWDALSAALAKGGEVILSADVTAPAERTCILEVPAGVTASLDLNGFTLDGGTPGEEDCVVLVHGSFTLTDTSAGVTGRVTGTRDGVDVIGGAFTLSGGTLDACGNNGVVAAEGGRLTMTGGAVRGSGQIGVYVTGEDSTAIISGGEISGSVGYYEDGWFYHGTGLQVEYGAAAEIAGGVISGNVFGAKAVEATLTLSGGEVRDNYEVPLGDEITYGGAGLYVYQGRLRMTGGTVSGNTWTGLYTDDGSVTEVSGGKIVGDGFFAVDMRGGDVTVAGGEIIGGRESGVRLLDGELHLDGGAVSGSPKVAVWILGGAVTMTDGAISDCTLNGVYLDAGSFTMSGGEIRDCGFYGVVLNGDAALTLQGAPVFARNGVDLALGLGKTVTVGGPLTLAQPLTVFLGAAYNGGVAEVPVTVGLSGNGSTADFVYSGQVYEIVTGADGEAKAAYIPRFSDVTGAEWYASAASYAAVYGLMDAHDGRFDGNQPLTTADLFMALWRYAGSPKVETDAPWPYSDVAADAPLADAIRWVESRGAVPEVPGLAGPDELVERWNMLSICLLLPVMEELYDSAEVSGELPFTDAGELNEEWTRYALWLTEVGILRGMGDGTMGLEQTATRAQLATVLMRLSEVLG